jgi:hypothetical protein
LKRTPAQRELKVRKKYNLIDQCFYGIDKKGYNILINKGL